MEGAARFYVPYQLILHVLISTAMLIGVCIFYNVPYDGGVFINALHTGEMERHFQLAGLYFIQRINAGTVVVDTTIVHFRCSYCD